jgi:hypothetical protein
MNEQRAAILRLFVPLLEASEDPLLPLERLLEGASDPREVTRRSSEIDELVNLGWLVVSPNLHWERAAHCLLCGNGVTTARKLMADDQALAMRESPGRSKR